MDGLRVGALLGLDRDDDYTHAEREEPEWIALVTEHAALSVNASMRLRSSQSLAKAPGAARQMR
jgi:hypothetical protein